MSDPLTSPKRASDSVDDHLDVRVAENKRRPNLQDVPVAPRAPDQDPAVAQLVDDALASALVMARRIDELMGLRPQRDYALEGKIWA